MRNIYFVEDTTRLKAKLFMLALFDGQNVANKKLKNMVNVGNKFNFNLKEIVY